MPDSNGVPPKARNVTRNEYAQVYRVYDRGTGVLLYVGCTNNPGRRQLEHHFTQRYRRDDVRYEVDAPLPLPEALADERRQVCALGPLDNERLRPESRLSRTGPDAPRSAGHPSGISVACPVVWDARSSCSAWGARMGSHGCRHDPGHEGNHRCPCGAWIDWRTTA